jgi:hypothetical protein
VEVQVLSAAPMTLIPINCALFSYCTYFISSVSGN